MGWKGRRMRIRLGLVEWTKLVAAASEVATFGPDKQQARRKPWPPHTPIV